MALVQGKAGRACRCNDSHNPQIGVVLSARLIFGKGGDANTTMGKTSLSLAAHLLQIPPVDSIQSIGIR